MGIWKGRINPEQSFTPAEMLAILQDLDLKAIATPSGGIFLAAEPAVAWALDACCIGQPPPPTHTTSNMLSSRVSLPANGGDMSPPTAGGAAAAAAETGRVAIASLKGLLPAGPPSGVATVEPGRTEGTGSAPAAAADGRGEGSRTAAGAASRVEGQRGEAGAIPTAAEIIAAVGLSSAASPEVLQDLEAWHVAAARGRGRGKAGARKGRRQLRVLPGVLPLPVREEGGQLGGDEGEEGTGLDGGGEDAGGEGEGGEGGAQGGGEGEEGRGMQGGVKDAGGAREGNGGGEGAEGDTWRVLGVVEMVDAGAVEGEDKEHRQEEGEGVGGCGRMQQQQQEEIVEREAIQQKGGIEACDGHQQQQQQARWQPRRVQAPAAGGLSASAAVGGNMTVAYDGVVQLQLEEACFLQRVLGCLKVWAAAAAGGGGGVDEVMQQGGGEGDEGLNQAHMGQQKQGLRRKLEQQELHPQLQREAGEQAHHQQQQQEQQGTAEEQERRRQPQQPGLPRQGQHEQHPQPQGIGREQPRQQQQEQQFQLLDEADLWQWCSAVAEGGNSSSSSFGVSYAVYHHFRSKGWLPRPGLAYGAHYVLYERHPAFVHARYVARIVPEPYVAGGEGRPLVVAGGEAGGVVLHREGRGGGTAEMQGEGAGVDVVAASGEGGVSGTGRLPRGVSVGTEGSGDRQCQQAVSAAGAAFGPTSSNTSSRSVPLTWLDVEIMHRLAHQVFKQLLLVYVRFPDVGVDWWQPSCLEQVEVVEMLVQRWVPQEAREAGGGMGDKK